MAPPAYLGSGRRPGGLTVHRQSSSTGSTFEAPTAVLDDIAGDFTIDSSHSRLGLSARHAMVTTVRSAFKDFSGTAHLDTTDPAASSVTLSIQAAGMDSGSPDRDGHLVSGDFFDAATYPELTFVSSAVERSDDTTWLVTGDLTI